VVDLAHAASCWAPRGPAPPGALAPVHRPWPTVPSARLPPCLVLPARWQPEPHLVPQCRVGGSPGIRRREDAPGGGHRRTDRRVAGGRGAAARGVGRRVAAAGSHRPR